MTSDQLSLICLRLIFNVGVNSPSSIEKSLGNIENFFICSGLENFGLSEEEPNLFDSAESNHLNQTNNDELSPDNQEEDDYEIPAFLRRQKN